MELPFVELHSETRITDSARSFTPLTQALIRLFMLGEGMSPDELEHALSRETVADLIAAGLMIVSDGSVRARWLIATYLNRYFLASPPLSIRPYSRREGIVYVGAESYWVARFVASSGPYDSVLDLGTGTGLLACMADARRVLGVEVDPAAAEVAAFNVMLNGLQNRVEIQVGDLYESVPGRKFDLIVANPPFMPAPEGTHLPTCGDGGHLGDDVLKRVLAGLDRHLGPAGQALVYAEAFGDFEEPQIVRWLRETDLGALKFSVFVRSTQSLEAASLGLTLLWQETGASEEAAWKAWRYLAEELDASYHHAFLIIGNRGSGGVSVHHPYRV
jgi:tRNA1(Val) A37 N6-methylase TrmN6